jgi:hypothetical protein
MLISTLKAMHYTVKVELNAYSTVVQSCIDLKYMLKVCTESCNQLKNLKRLTHSCKD